MDDRALKRLMRTLEQQDYTVKVGVLGSAGNHEHITMVELAAIHEFGSPKNNIPERSFIRSTLEEKHKEIAQMISQLAAQIVSGKLNSYRAHEILGAWAASAVKNKITQGPHIPPPLKPGTIKAKGSSRPLVDTGRLVQSITYEVVKGEG